MRRLPDKSFWDHYWEEQSDNTGSFVFGPLLEHLTSKAYSTYFEIGCSPGTTLIHFAQKYGYQVNGLDYSSLDVTRQNLDRHGITDYELIACDFLRFQTDKRYDIVASYGFIEHFEQPEQVIRQHADLVSDGGLLIIEVPNIRYFNYLLYRIMDSALLSAHNLSIMDARRLRQAVETAGSFDILYNGYYKSSFLSFNPDNRAISGHPWRRRIIGALRKLHERLHMDNYPSRYFSPYLIIIARKRRSESHTTQDSSLTVD